VAADRANTLESDALVFCMSVRPTISARTSDIAFEDCGQCADGRSRIGFTVIRSSGRNNQTVHRTRKDAARIAGNRTGVKKGSPLGSGAGLEDTNEQAKAYSTRVVY
jgi:hypothetical protein